MLRFQGTYECPVEKNRFTIPRLIRKELGDEGLRLIDRGDQNLYLLPLGYYQKHKREQFLSCGMVSPLHRDYNPDKALATLSHLRYNDDARIDDGGKRLTIPSEVRRLPSAITLAGTLDDHLLLFLGNRELFEKMIEEKRKLVVL